MKVEERRRLTLVEKRLVHLEHQQRGRVDTARRRVEDARAQHSAAGAHFRSHLALCRRMQGSQHSIGLAHQLSQALQQQEMVDGYDTLVVGASAALRSEQAVSQEVMSRNSLVVGRLAELANAITEVVEGEYAEDIDSIKALDDATIESDDNEEINEVGCIHDPMVIDAGPIEGQLGERTPWHREQQNEPQTPNDIPFPDEQSNHAEVCGDWHATVSEGSVDGANHDHTSVQVAIPVGVGRKVSIAVLCDRLARIRVMLSTKGEGISISSEALRSYLLGQNISAVEVAVQTKREL